MRAVINNLIQLEELGFTKSEQNVTGNKETRERLDASIVSMAENLPDDVRTTYQKLRTKYAVFITPIAQNGCSACGLRLPRSLVQLVRRADMVHCCPNCARILYWPELPVHYAKQPRRRSDPVKAGISRFSSTTLMIPRLKSTDKAGIISEMSEKMMKEGFIDDGSRLKDAALQREAIISTAVDHGLALPHVRGVEGGGLTLALGISKKGVHFDSPNKKLTHIFFFMTIPTAASGFYLRLLAGLTETFMNAEARKAITVPKEPEKLWAALVKLTRKTIR